MGKRKKAKQKLDRQNKIAENARCFVRATYPWLSYHYYVTPDGQLNRMIMTKLFIYDSATDANRAIELCKQINAGEDCGKIIFEIVPWLPEYEQYLS